MGKYAPVHEQIQIAIANTKEKTRQNLIAAAKAANDQIMNTDPKPLGVTITVDGVAGASLDDAQYDSIIDFKYLRLDDIAAFALQTLRDLSPVGGSGESDVHPGEYRDAHTLVVNGATASDLSGWTPGATAYIYNPVPYARKIEMGTMAMQVPGTDHVYQQAEQLVNAAKGAGRVKFTYITPPSAGPASGSAGRKIRKPSASHASDDRVPALQFLQGGS